MPRFRISKTPQQYGFRWSILDSEGGLMLHEMCRCTSMANASLIRDALNLAARDVKTWTKALGKASTAYSTWEERRSARIVNGASSRRKTPRPGGGSAAQPAVPRQGS